MDKIICVGKNYLDHARELGDAVPERPLFFFKPPSALVRLPADAKERPFAVTWPNRADLHFECELVLAIGAGCGFTHFGVGLDMTLRDRQAELKKAGHPWEAAKVFEHAAVVSPFLPFGPGTTLGDVLDLELKLVVNGRVRQMARPRDMRVGPEALLQEIKKLFPVVDGDLLFTGTPAGVGTVADGDRLELSLGSETFHVGARLK